MPALVSINAHVQNIERVTGYPPNHLVPRATAKIKWQLDRLDAIYHSVLPEIKGLEDELRELTARQDGLRRTLEAADTRNFKLTCAKKEIADEADGWKATASEREAALQRQKSEIEELASEHQKLDESHRKLESERLTVDAGKVYLEDVLKKRDAEIGKLTAENFSLKSLAQEHGSELAKVKAENARLQGLIRQREAEMSCLATGLPYTPSSPLVPLISFPILGAPAAQAPFGGGHGEVNGRASPAPYIKQEVPDRTAPGAEVAPESGLSETPQDATEQLSQLGAGLTDILTKVFQITRPIGREHNEGLLVTFVSGLGAASSPPQIEDTPATYFWELKESWTADPIIPAELHPTLEEQFAHLLLLFPFPTATTDGDNFEHDQPEISPAIFHLLASLLNSLIKADHSVSPRAGLAFLETMAAQSASLSQHPHQHHNYHSVLTTPAPLASTSPDPAESNSSYTYTVVLAIMLCELCGVLERRFPGWEKKCGNSWDIAGVMGLGFQRAVEDTPLGRLAAALQLQLRDQGGSVASVREVLAARCGDRFCSFPRPQQVTELETRRGDEGGSVEESEMGLLHCDEERFLMVDLGERSLRLVDCQLADHERNREERRKLDLMVVKGKEELWKLDAAPREVAAFWFKYVMGGV